MKVCIIAEGSYPVRRGGLSTLAHFLINAMKDDRFDVYCVSDPAFHQPVYPKLPNVDNFIIVPLLTSVPVKRRIPRELAGRIGVSLTNTLFGTPMDLEPLIAAYKKYHSGKNWLLTRACWDSIVAYYSRYAPEESFVDAYWNIFNIYALIFDILSGVDRLPRADVYHALSAGHAGIMGSFGKLLYGAPFILTEQGFFLTERQNELSHQKVTPFYMRQHMRFAEAIVKTVYRYADRVVPPSARHVAIERSMGVPETKIQVIRNGIEVDKFMPGPAKNGHVPVVGCFARIVPIKAIDNLIKAAKLILEKQPAEFVVVGEVQEQKYYEECQKLVDALGLGERFHFIGYADALEWYHKVDIFTLASHSEGVPYALLEAMSCGLPSVCTDVGGVPEMMPEGTGYIVPPNKPEALAEKLGELIANPQLRKEMGAKATQVANARYDVRDMARNFHELYKAVCR